MTAAEVLGIFCANICALGLLVAACPYRADDGLRAGAMEMKNEQ